LNSDFAKSDFDDAFHSASPHRHRGSEAQAIRGMWEQELRQAIQKLPEVRFEG
jgi:hypothetical protein